MFISLLTCVFLTANMLIQAVMIGVGGGGEGLLKDASFRDAYKKCDQY